MDDDDIHVSPRELQSPAHDADTYPSGDDLKACTVRCR